LVHAGDVDGVMELLTNREVETRVLAVRKPFGTLTILKIESAGSSPPVSPTVTNSEPS